MHADGANGVDWHQQADPVAAAVAGSEVIMSLSFDIAYQETILSPQNEGGFVGVLVECSTRLPAPREQSSRKV